MDFNQLPTTKRGDIGEQIVDDYLIERGCRLYKPEEGPHPIDRFMVNAAGHAFAYDVKTYPRLFSSNKTGIDIPDYYKYCQMDPVPVLLFFVDAFEGCLYFHQLNRKDGHRAPVFDKQKVYFHLSDMTFCRSLTAGEVARIGGIKQPERYKNVKRHFPNLKTGNHAK